ncbi:N-formylglutamate amidohydrolase [Chthonobacter rhizosphaerae]|uniref:N-formylglutamate amidohydrolase n=1 Tax=Chthonobacter rhizosphaerae TaxID=2735553 RepID=UPI0015EE9F3B|nr:N-formylglutamate amidohydrolase [Chthonobacter rhizosphaerae]
MRVVADFVTEAPFEVTAPADQTQAFVFNSPHSGNAYPVSFLEASRLDSRRIRLSEDAHVDRLFDHVVQRGAPLVRAHFPRAYLDVNREPYELDPKMFAGRLPSYANIRSIRVAGGLGTIARVVAEAEEIYHGPIAVEEALDRIEAIYKPYHALLRRVLAQTHVRFGAAVLIDCHSMPSNVRGQDPRTRADFVLGDRYGTAACRGLVEHAADLLTDLGYTVAVNKPYAGGFITEHYGRPAKGLHALQIEVNRGLYMDERSFQETAGFLSLKADIARFANALMDYPVSALVPTPSRLAAE